MGFLDYIQKIARATDSNGNISPIKTLQDEDTGRIAIYYGAADTNVGLAFTTVDEIVTYIKEHSDLQWGDDIPDVDY